MKSNFQFVELESSRLEGESGDQEVHCRELEDWLRSISAHIYTWY
jgi:hypothetical protein